MKKQIQLLFNQPKDILSNAVEIEQVNSITSTASKLKGEVRKQQNTKMVKRKRGRPPKSDVDYRQELYTHARYSLLYNWLPKNQFMTFGNILQTVNETGINGIEDTRKFSGKFIDLAVKTDLMSFKMIDVEGDKIIAFCFADYRLVTYKI